MADARAQKLQLVSLGGALSGSDTAIHDWHFVFGKLHMLGMSSFIGNSIRAVGHLAGLCGVLFATWIIYKMAVAASVPATADTASAESLAVAKPAHIVATPIAVRGSKPIYPEPTRGTLAPHHDPTLDNPKLPETHQEL